MKRAILLVIEGKHADIPAFAPALQKKGFDVVTYASGSEAYKRLTSSNTDLVVINAASLRTTGVRICQSLREKNEKLPIVLIVDEEAEIEKAECDVLLHLPFTAQKLVNRIKPLLPGDGANMLHVGPIRLDVEQRRVRAVSRSTRLTPRLVALLKVLLEKHGEVVEREALFKKVWETEYTGDTRTLDVHISWLRRAIEVDPGDPKFLKTIRGVGYRLDV
jgi:DNA-binding response OmpR family regulator